MFAGYIQCVDDIVYSYVRSLTRVAGKKSKSINGTMIPPTLIRSLVPDLTRRLRLCVTFTGRNAPCLSRSSAPPRAEACSSRRAEQ